MSPLSSSTNIIVSIGRVVIKILGLYGLIYFGYTTSQIILYTVLVTLAEGYELLAMFITAKRSTWLPFVYSAVTALNSGLLVTLLYLTGNSDGQYVLYGFMLVLVSAVPGGFLAGLVAGLCTGLAYLGLDRFGDASNISLSIVPFFLIAGLVFGFVSNQRLEAFKERDRLREKSTRQNEVDRLKNEFISIASHNLRTPITAVNGYVEIMAGKEDVLKKEPAFNQLLDGVKLNMDKLNKMLDSFLDMASLEEDRYKVTMAKADIYTVIDKAVDTEKSYAEQRGVSVEVFRPDKQLPELDIDVENLYRALSNIVNNAIKFSQEHGKVTIEARQDKSQVVVSTKDDGIGMEEEAKKQIFQKFHRGTDLMQYDYEGVGVGLYMAKLIIEAHGGKIWLESKPGNGTTVYFSLPLARVDTLVEDL